MEDGYTATTGMIEVTVHPVYLEDQSDPDENKFVWAYRVRIHNKGQVTVQLLRRTWHITDGRGRVINVEGAGVIGELPVLEPGESFEYTSGTPLETPTGFMRGFYHMIATNSGEPFDVTIPTFSLDSPHGRNQIH
jgi:ApaG protein